MYMKQMPLTTVLLTYKGKALLMHKQKNVLDENSYPWVFISETIDKKQNSEKILRDKIEKEMGIIVENIEKISDYCYHGRLTDDNVNNIKRSTNQLLDFFTLNEIKKLNVSDNTRQFIIDHGLCTEASIQQFKS